MADLMHAAGYETDLASDGADAINRLETSESNRSSVGLGLYIVQTIVTAHGGTIDVDSTDKGTTFTMRLPRRASKPAAERRGATA